MGFRFHLHGLAGDRARNLRRWNGSDRQRTWIELLFLSFSRLSNVGLGDVVPIKPFARSLVMLEQIAGLAYIAMVVSRLVSLTIRRRSGDRPRSIRAVLRKR